MKPSHVQEHLDHSDQALGGLENPSTISTAGRVSFEGKEKAMLQAQGKVCREAYEKIAAKMEDIIEELEEAVTTAAETAALRVHHA